MWPYWENVIPSWETMFANTTLCTPGKTAKTSLSTHIYILVKTWTTHSWNINSESQICCLLRCQHALSTKPQALSIITCDWRTAGRWVQDDIQVFKSSGTMENRKIPTGHKTCGTWLVCIILIVNNSNNNNNTFISPHNIQEIKNCITAVQTMIGALAARNNLRVKNARQPVKRKDV